MIHPAVLMLCLYLQVQTKEHRFGLQFSAAEDIRGVLGQLGRVCIDTLCVENMVLGTDSQERSLRICYSLRLARVQGKHSLLS